MREKHLHTDPDLLLRVAESDEAAFRLLFDQYSNKIFSLALRLTKNRETSEDIVQEVFVKLWLHKQELPALDSFEAWLRTITRNHIFNRLRRLATEESFLRQLLADKELGGDNQTLHTIAHNELHRILQAAVEQLSPRQKKVYLMGKQEGMKYEDIAAALALSKDTVKFHMSEALKSIKTYLLRHEKNLFLFIMILCEKWVR